MPKPESIEALLSPSLRVSRPVAACSRCRGAKIKCDGKLPACTACDRSGKADSCSGANDEFAKGKERSYVAALEAASERLQKRIADAKSSQPSTSENNLRDGFGPPSSGSGYANSSPPVRTASMGRVQRKEASDVDDLVGDFGFLSVNATSRDFHGLTMSFARLLLSVSLASELPEFDSTPLPPRYAATPLIQKYLDNIFVLLPFFSETELMASVSAVYQDSGRHAKASDHWFVRMVLAISAGSVSHSRGDQNHETSLRHMYAAMSQMEAVIHPGSIAGLQAILLLVQYSMVDPEHFRSWHLIGIACRVLVDLGLHVEPSPETKITKEGLDMRRRVFYCVYALDRAISMSLGRGFSFTEDAVSVFLPVIPHSTIPSDPERYSTPQLFLRSLRPSLYLFDIRRVQSTFYETTQASSRDEWPASTSSEYVQAMLNDVRSWYSSIPGSLSHGHILFFRLESLYSQILALSPSCRIPLSQMTDLNKTLIFEYAIQYADQMQPVIQDPSWHAFLTFPDIVRVGTIGRQFLAIMWSNFDQLLSGGVPHSPLPPAQAGSAQHAPPFNRTTSPLENCARAIRCLNNMIEILEYARQRWGLGYLRDRFEQEAAVLVGKLRNKQQELGTLKYNTGTSSQSQQRPSHRPSVALGGSQGSRMPDILLPQMVDRPTAMHSLSNGSLEDLSPPIPFTRSLSFGNASNSGSGSYMFPPASLPRRSYEFLGGHGEQEMGNGGAHQP